MVMRKTRRKFTQEQIDKLMANKFTFDVSAYTIQFTLEFKNIFIARYESGESARLIFESMGYDADVLGESRIGNIAYKWSKMAKEGILFSEEENDYNPSNPIDYNIAPAQVTIAAMQREITYMKTQLEYLKKIIILERGEK